MVFLAIINQIPVWFPYLDAFILQVWLGSKHLPNLDSSYWKTVTNHPRPWQKGGAPEDGQPQAIACRIISSQSTLKVGKAKKIFDRKKIKRSLAMMNSIGEFRLEFICFCLQTHAVHYFPGLMFANHFIQCSSLGEISSPSDYFCVFFDLLENST